MSEGKRREPQEIDPGDACPVCGGELRVAPKARIPSWRTFGATEEDVSEFLEMIAARLKVIEIARVKKSCRRCERMVQSPAPSRPIPGSMAGPGLLAHVLVSEFDDHVPLYHQNEIFARMGADIRDSTLVDWVKTGPEGSEPSSGQIEGMNARSAGHGRAMKVLHPILQRIEAEIMAGDLLHAPSADCFAIGRPELPRPCRRGGA